jgi:hypothetical protein
MRTSSKQQLRLKKYAAFALVTALFIEPRMRRENLLKIIEGTWS